MSFFFSSSWLNPCSCGSWLVLRVSGCLCAWVPPSAGFFRIQVPPWVPVSVFRQFPFAWEAWFSRWTCRLFRSAMFARVGGAGGGAAAVRAPPLGVG